MKQFPKISNEAELFTFLNEFEGYLRQKRETLSRLEYTKLIEKRLIPEIVPMQEELSALVSDPAFASIILAWDGQVEDPVLARRVGIWKKNLIHGKVDNHPEIMRLERELNDAMITYPYKVAGKESSLGAIRDILRTSPDRNLRHEAWLAKHAMSEELTPRLLELIALRNQVARETGFASYPDMTLELSGMSFSQVKKLLLELKEASDPIYHRVLADGKALLGLEEIEHWDLAYLLESLGGVDPVLFPKNKIAATLQKWALAHGTDLKALGIQMVEVDIPYNGLCFTLTEGEINILSNPADGHNSYRTMFHEMGHAFHSAYNRQTYPTFRHESGVFSESMAEVFGYVTRNVDWLREMGVNEEAILDLQKRLIAPWFHFLRERTAFALAEYEIYENPGVDPDAVLAQVECDVLGIAPVDTPRWAADAWYISYPIYWQNYVIADIIASQIHKRLREQFGGLHGHPEAFQEVQRAYIVPGNTIDWQERLLQHSGSDLSVDAIVEDLRVYLQD